MYQFHQEQHFHTLQLAQQTKLNTSKSWVMTTPGQESFIKLPNERVLYTSPPRTALEISSPKTTGPEACGAYAVKSDAGLAYITNQRVCPPNPNLKLIPIPDTPANQNKTPR